ncbi:MAG: RnfABCDGE type electron transport complex subunit B [Lachnospiraceae bacterium]|nr:RnfABCDGE type electron transport complex subunit B [Lachnospiraceae bacterium]
MNITAILVAAVVVGVVGVFIGFFLGFAGKKFAVEVDEREEAILGVLPGNNCGGCGYAGCSGLAAAIVKGEAEVNQCPVGGSTVANQIGAIMGIEASEGKRMTAFVRCSGTTDKTKSDYSYSGLVDCRAMSYVPNGGPKHCDYGCLGYGSCVKACPFDAIHIVNGIAKVDREACKACGKCVAVCPKSLIEIIPYDSVYVVRCGSKGKGKVVIDACSTGCIGCGLCQKNCEAGAITVIDNIARIDYDKCTHCGVCVEKCPKKIIVAHAEL